MRLHLLAGGIAIIVAAHHAAGQSTSPAARGGGHVTTWLHGWTDSSDDDGFARSGLSLKVTVLSSVFSTLARYSQAGE